MQQHGGEKLLRLSNNSLFYTLHSIYSEFEWNPQLFQTAPRSIWEQTSSRRKTFDWLAEQLGIERQEQWKEVSLDDLKETGTDSMISKHFNNSMFDALVSVYPEFDWNELDFIHNIGMGSFKRKLMDRLAEKLEIEEQEDWYDLTIDIVRRLGLGSLLSVHNNSLHLMMKDVYPEFHWNPQLFHSVMKINIFKNRQKFHRNIMERIGERLGIDRQEDWFAVSGPQVSKLGGKQVLGFYSGSLAKTLARVFPEYDWQPDQFLHPPRELLHYKPRNFWRDFSHQKNFIDELSIQLKIQKQEDWYNFSGSDVYKVGGTGVMYHCGSLLKVLQYVYPQYTWNPLLFRTPPIRWKDPLKNRQLHRSLMDELANQLRIETQSDWYDVKRHHLRSYGRSDLITVCRGSVIDTLRYVYPEFEWNPLLMQTGSLKNVDMDAQLVKDTLDDIIEDSMKFITS